MSTVEICDICGKQIFAYESEKKYKIKKPKYSWYSPRNPWEDISAHCSCIELLLAARDRNITVAEIEEEVKRRFVDNADN